MQCLVAIENLSLKKNYLINLDVTVREEDVPSVPTFPVQRGLESPCFAENAPEEAEAR